MKLSQSVGPQAPAARGARTVLLAATTALGVTGWGCGDDDPSSAATMKVCELTAECARDYVVGDDPVQGPAFFDGFMEQCLEDDDCVDTCETVAWGRCAEKWVHDQGFADCSSYCGESSEVESP